MDSHSTIADVILPPLAGWFFLVFGLALIGMALLTPSWLSAQRVAWQKRVMQVQTRQLDKQAEKYRQFNEALDDNNPTVLERLAFLELREQPADKDVLGPQTANRRAKSVWGATLAADEPPGKSAQPPPKPGDASIDAWLAEPMPQVGVNVPAWRAPDTRVIRLATGNSRWGLLAAGVCCVLGGLWWNPKT